MRNREIVGHYKVTAYLLVTMPQDASQTAQITEWHTHTHKQKNCLQVKSITALY